MAKSKEFWPEIKPQMPRERVCYRLAATFTREQYEELARMSEDENTPQTQLIRIAVDELLARKRRERAA